MTSSINNRSIFSDLFKRRVPHILFLYIAGCWTVVQIVEWIISRYLVSPHLVDLCLVSMVSFIPSICLIAYFHGTPGRDNWQPVEKIGIPLNIVVSIIMVFIVFSPKDLGAVTESIIIEDENGNLVQKVIPKSEFRKKIAIYYFENESGDSTLDWLRYGIPWLCEHDLDQDLYISDIRQNSFESKVENAGYTQKDNLPLSLKKKISTTLNKNYFIEGSFNLIDDSYIIKTKLFRTDNGNIISENRFVDANIFSLADKLVKQLKIDLEISFQYLNTTTDLPISSISTDNKDAFKSYILGKYESGDNNYDAAIAHYNKSIEYDKYFLQAQYAIAMLKMNYTQDVSWKEHSAIVMKGIDKLSDRTKFWYKIGYYRITGDDDLYKRLAIRQVKLYPHDIEAHEALAIVYWHENNPDRFDNAINEYKIMLTLDPEKYELYKDIGDAYYGKNDLENVIHYYEKYSKIFVDDSEILSGISRAYRELGKLDQSTSIIEDAILLSNEELYLQLMLLFNKYQMQSLNSSQIIDKLTELLSKSKNYKDSVFTYYSLKRFSFDLGNVKNSYDYVEKIRNMYFAKYDKKVAVEMLLEENQINIFKHLDMMDSVRTFLDYHVEHTVEPYDKAIPYYECIYYLYRGNYDMLAATIDAAEAGYEEY